MIVLTWTRRGGTGPTFYFAGPEKSWSDKIEEAVRFNALEDLLQYFLAIPDTSRGWFRSAGGYNLYHVEQSVSWRLGEKLA